MEGEDTNSTATLRGYQRLPQGDIDMEPVNQWDRNSSTNQHPNEQSSQPQQPPPHQQNAGSAPPHGSTPQYTPPTYFQGGGYAPAPQSFPQPTTTQQSSSNNSNVVVVNQPSSDTSQPVVVVERERPKDYLISTLVLMAVCCIIGHPGSFICLVPALILSLSSVSARNAGDYETAERYSRASRIFTICSVVFYILTFGVVIIAVTAIITTGTEAVLVNV